VRDCDRIIGLLDAKTKIAEEGGRMPKHLMITRYDTDRAKTGDMLATDDVVDILSVPLIGVVPESKDVLKASNVGLPVTLSDENSLPAKAYMEATRRLLGENIPVTIPEEKKSLFGKLFKGRAA
jgi:septum site-determining protein MinD